jgi:two-component system sensor histidine kinase/response regulator
MAKILIVDDEPVNRDVLIAFLDGAGHELIEAGNGKEALEQVAKHSPDLLLLDLMMPELDGFGVIRQLRAQVTEYLPIILVTARADQASRVEGLDVGADEFLTKPVDPRELVLRVSNLLRLRSRERELLKMHVEQVELHRFKDELAALIAHDLTNPVSAVIANLSFLRQEAGLPEPFAEALEDASVASQRVLRLIQNLQDVGRLESDHVQIKRAPTQLAALAHKVVAEYGLLLRSKDITVRVTIDPGLRASIDVDLVTRLAASLFDRAVRVTPAHGRIDIGGELEPSGTVRLTLGHGGAPIALAARLGLFEKYGQPGAKVGRTSLGLGFYFCRLVAEAHGGSIAVDETADHPTLFRVELGGG